MFFKGISIVGGKLDVCSSSNSNSSSGGGGGGGVGRSSVGQQVSSFISGIFIKHVLDNSPAGVNGTLKTGDRILAVNDIDLTQATHDRAVEVIRNARSPVKFLIQSLIYINTYTPTCDEDVLSSTSSSQQVPVTPPPTTTTTSQNESTSQLPLATTDTAATPMQVTTAAAAESTAELDENLNPNSQVN